MIVVLIPAYNEARYISYSLRRLLDDNNDMPDLCVIVVDDGSIDQTAGIVAQIATQDPRLRLIKQVNSGVSVTRNTLLDSIPEGARYVTFLDADDIFPADRLKRDIAILESDPTLDLVYGQLCLVDCQDVDMAAQLGGDEISVRSISVTTGTYRREVLGRVGKFDTSLIQGEDLDYLLRLFEMAPNAHLLDEVSVYYRQHPNNSTKNQREMRRGAMRAMLLHAKRIKNDPTLARIEGVFDLSALKKPTPASNPLPDYSVVIPAYNAATYIGEALDSVFAQSHAPRQVIVVNDGSTDDLRTALGGYLDRITLIEQDNQGPGAATMAGVALVEAEYLATLDADDMWLPEKMKAQFTELRRDPGIDACVTLMRSFGEKDVRLGVKDEQSGWTRSTLLIRLQDFHKAGAVEDTDNRLGEMVDWFAKAREAGIVFRLIATPFAKRRLHNGSLTACARSAGKADYMAAAIRALRRRKDSA